MVRSRETARAVRGEKAAILRDWQQEAQARLWHVEKTLLARKGAATNCAAATLALLADYHQNGGFFLVTAPPDSAATTPEPADSAPALVAPEAGAGNLRPPLEACAENWRTLPVAWTDIRLLVETLCTHALQALALRGVAAESLARSEGLFAALLAAIADRRIGQLEQQVASHREETTVSQHLANRFLANASHELRTPLTAVLGFAELLLEETYGELTPEQRTAISHIENSAQNLLEVVNNLLDLLRIRAGKLTLQMRPLAITPLLRNIYEILLPLANRKGVGFSIELSEDLGMIEADENILRHILYHLLSSALRATPADGQVTLHAVREETTLTIFTHDTALHLPPEAIANMSDPFPLLENSPARGFEGWEVGLPLVSRYVELHNGTLELDSEPGEGTTFRIVLPIGRPANRTTPL
ncbi:MAG TPA: HAMP domain-containing sensor histidine kinase [Chthonomonadaceae bacterium]|nr:HAMP domain-containing sensor histidine kinase [Chthonomonadaceae bacterium]